MNSNLSAPFKFVPRARHRPLTLSLTECTFLGPSRKRGPPKGYIDAIEARLHQTEALIGILLSSKDSRAKSVLDDLAEVSLIPLPFVAYYEQRTGAIAIFGHTLQAQAHTAMVKFANAHGDYF